MSRFEDATEAELIAWEERHDEIVAWGIRWSFLTVILAVIGIAVTLFAANAYGGLALLVPTAISCIAQQHFARKHRELHEEREDVE